MQTYSYHVRHKNGWRTGFGPRPTHCHECGAALPEPAKDSISAGYGCGPSEAIGTHPDAPTLRKSESLERAPAICFACCAKHDRNTMDRKGRIALYLVKQADGWHVTNWPGSLDYRVTAVRKGRHNMARTRYDAWFRDHAGKKWHAVQYGENTQIAHCRRLST